MLDKVLTWPQPYTHYYTYNQSRDLGTLKKALSKNKTRTTRLHHTCQYIKWSIYGNVSCSCSYNLPHFLQELLGKWQGIVECWVTFISCERTQQTALFYSFMNIHLLQSSYKWNMKKFICTIYLLFIPLVRLNKTCEVILNSRWEIATPYTIRFFASCKWL